MRFSVYLKSQEPLSEKAAHETSRDRARHIVDASLARQIGQNSIQLTTGESWSTVKAKFRARPGQPLMPTLLAPLDLYLPYNYPLPAWLLESYCGGIPVSARDSWGNGVG